MDNRTEQEVTNDLLSAILCELRSQMEYAIRRDAAIAADLVEAKQSVYADFCQRYAKELKRGSNE